MIKSSTNSSSRKKICTLRKHLFFITLNIESRVFHSLPNTFFSSHFYDLPDYLFSFFSSLYIPQKDLNYANRAVQSFRIQLITAFAKNSFANIWAISRKGSIHLVQVFEKPKPGCTWISIQSFINNPKKYKNIHRFSEFNKKREQKTQI